MYSIAAPSIGVRRLAAAFLRFAFLLNRRHPGGSPAPDPVGRSAVFSSSPASLISSQTALTSARPHLEKEGPVKSIRLLAVLFAFALLAIAAHAPARAQDAAKKSAAASNAAV